MYPSSKCIFFSFIYISIMPFLPRSNILVLLVLTSENESSWVCIIFYFTGFVCNKHKTQMKSPFFWDVVPCHYITDTWCCKTAYWSHHQENWTFLPLQTRPLSSSKYKTTITLLFFLTFCWFFFNSLHVSSTLCSSSGETNCVNTTSGSCHSVSVAVSCAGPLPTCTWHGHRHRVTATRGYTDTICLSWWWAQCAWNM